MFNVSQSPPNLEEIRARIDSIDDRILRLVDERAAIATEVAAAKRASGAEGFGLRPAREAQVLRRLLAQPRSGASDALVERIWRELISDSLARQGAFQLTVWGGPHAAEAAELARGRFGSAPGLVVRSTPEEAIAGARAPGGVGVLWLAPESAWWGRLLAAPDLNIVAAMPGFAAQGPVRALAVAAVEVEPSGHDETFWVTDSSLSARAIADALARDGAAAHLVASAGGLKLFALAGFFQKTDSRLARAPGDLKGVIGCAAIGLDL